MGILKRKVNRLSQVEWAMEQLLAGKCLTQLDMLFDYGIGQHCDVIMRCRKILQSKGYPYDYIKTDFIQMRSKRTGRLIRFASYSIPELAEKAK